MEKRTTSACVPNAPVDVNTLTLTSKFRRYLVVVRLCSVYGVTIDIDLEGATLKFTTDLDTGLRLYIIIPGARTSHFFSTIQICPSNHFIWINYRSHSISISLFTFNLLATMS